jgi:hypothetical protein
MSSVPHSLPRRQGTVLIGGLTGVTLLVEQFEVAPGADAAPHIARAMTTVWTRLPDLASTGIPRFSLVVSFVAVDNPEAQPADLVFQSGLDFPTLAATFARKLARVRLAAARTEVRLPPVVAPVEVVEGLPFDPADFAPLPRPIDRVRAALREVISGGDPEIAGRAARAESLVWSEFSEEAR